ncbi:uncharacterized protein LOC106376878 [Brassica napus]|uniref:uncharacterized protein LOC106376878 n=1 Tax=Brassica napus TaxID=3708 RepID=UPI00207AE131|nr:uncharacterized protein LOC106376878 [Brassica napus]
MALIQLSHGTHTSLKATHLQMANEGENHGADQPMNVLGVLNPSRVNGSLWFKCDSVITNEIRTIIRSDFPGPYRNWSTTPQHVKERWWFTFKSKFFWNHLIESEVRKMFCKCAETKLINMISRVKERDKQPYWILDDYYKDLVAYWGTDKAKEKK